MKDRIVIAGAGIGGLTAALAIAKAGQPVLVADQAARLEEIGAGIQVSPNASRILIALGLAERLAPHLTAPSAVVVRDGASGRTLGEIPLGHAVETRYGAPYWIVHRADLQSALVEACATHPAISLRLGTAYLRHRETGDGVEVTFRTADGEASEIGAALIGADGLWSSVRTSVDPAGAPRFRGRNAWRGLVAPDVLPPTLRTPQVHLWLGQDGHVVHYPVRGGRSINVVAVTAGADQGRGWSTPAQRLLVQAHFADWSEPMRGLLRAPDLWSAWSLYSLPPLSRWSAGRVTLLGDAAHALLPFVAQGAAMAIEDAAVLAHRLAGKAAPAIPEALADYEAARRPRTEAIAAAAQRAGRVYHLSGPAAFARNLAMRLLGGDGLRARHDWIYAWRPPATERPQ